MQYKANTVVALVIDDEGEQHEIVTTYLGGENLFAAVEQEAKAQGLRYADTIQVQFPEGRF